jgi:hypothetical protein
MENKNKMLFFFQDSKLEQVTSSSFILEVVCSLPFIVTVDIEKYIYFFKIRQILEKNLNNPKGASFKENHLMTKACDALRTTSIPTRHCSAQTKEYKIVICCFST